MSRFKAGMVVRLITLDLEAEGGKCHDLDGHTWGVVTEDSELMPEIAVIVFGDLESNVPDPHDNTIVLDVEYDTFEVVHPSRWPDEICAAVATYHLTGTTEPLCEGESA